MSDLLTQGLTLAAYGMGTVFVFLSLLVAATALMSKSVNSWSRRSNVGEDIVPARSQADLMYGTTSSVMKPQLLAAITSAVNAYRRDHPSQGDQD